MAITFGFVPIDITVVLAWDGSFIQPLEPQDAGGTDTTWPDDVTIELRLLASQDATPTVWTAVVSSDRTVATINESVTVVNAVIDAGQKIARLHYIDPALPPGRNDICWGRGRTKID